MLQQVVYLVVVSRVLDSSDFCEFHRRMEVYVDSVWQDREQGEVRCHELQGRLSHSPRHGWELYDWRVEVREVQVGQPCGVLLCDQEFHYCE